jgi:predicted nuclease of predicted toxin-antitoxin system
VAERIRFYMDEHVDVGVTEGLRRRHVDVLTAQDAGLASADDLTHLEFARAQGRVIVTQDADFLGFSKAGMSHPGIAYARQRTSIGRMVRGLLLIHEVYEPRDMADRVEFL